MNTDIYNVKNEKVGSIELPQSVFGVAWSAALVKQVLTAQLANARRSWAHAKTRAEVRGGGRKPWRQKGTGRARHGSTRSPIWVGGGKAHGPNSQRDYSQKVNKKMRQKALFCVLSKKLADSQLRVIDSLRVSEPKTKQAFTMLSGLLQLSPKAKKIDAALIAQTQDTTLTRAARNLVKTKIMHPQSLDLYELINHKHILIDQEAIREIAAHYKKTTV